MIGEIRDAVAVAGAVGLQVGLQIQADNQRHAERSAANEYQENLRLQLQQALDRVANRDTIIASKEAVISAQDREIARKNKLIDAQSEQILDLTKYRQYVDKQIKAILRQARIQSANYFAYEKIYQFLVKEHKQLNNAHDYEMLNPVKRQAVMESMIREFIKSGNDFHNADLDFEFEKRLKAAQPDNKVRPR